MRGITLILLAVLAFFVLSSAWDVCASDEGGCPPSCHASCPDGCASAPVPPAARLAAQPAPRATPQLFRSLELPPSYLTQPETPPPRA